MQKAEVVLDALHTLGTKNRPLQRGYRLLFNPHMYPCPADQRVTSLIENLKTQRFRWGQEPGRDELVHTILVRILTHYAAGRDGKYIHGLRPGTGIHSALKAARVIVPKAQWLGIWHLRNLPALRPDRIDALLAGKVEDRRFRDLLFHFLAHHPQPLAGPENLLTQAWLPTSLHGVCQHLALQELDQHLTGLAAAAGSTKAVGPSGFLPPLRYARYMNWLLVTGNGSREEASQWSKEISALAQGVSDSLPQKFTGLQEVTRPMAPMGYLGYELSVGEMGSVALRLSQRQAAEMQRIFQERGKPASRGERTRLPDKAICDLYDREFSAFAQFYALAENRRLLGSVQKTLRSSLWRTLAQKHKCRVSDVALRPGWQNSAPHLLQKEGKTRFQVQWIDDVQRIDPKQTLVGEPCAMKVACTVRREARV